MSDTSNGTPGGNKRMFSIFFIVFTTVIVLLQVYLIQKVWRTYPALGNWRWLFLAWGVLMLASLFGIMAYRRHGYPAFLNPLVDASYCWLVVTWWFLMANLLLGAWNLATRAVALARGNPAAWLVPAKYSVAAILALCLVGVVYGVIEASRVSVTPLKVEVKRRVGGRDRFRVVQISDLHLSDSSHPGWIADLVERIRALEPDVVVATGDMVDAPADRLAEFSALFAELRPPHGKFAVTGNHEFYVGIKEAEAWHKAAGFTMLRNTSVSPVDGLRIAGVDDPARRMMEGVAADGDDEARALGEKNDDVVVLLKHQPRVRPESVGKLNLQLSGHTHDGQVFPFWVFVRMVYPMMTGRYDLDEGSQLFVSRGVGTWGPPMRIGSPPEIVVVDLVTKPQPQD